MLEGFFHFTSSSTAGSAFLIETRSCEYVLLRQPPGSLMMASISREVDGAFDEGLALAPLLSSPPASPSTVILGSSSQRVWRFARWRLNRSHPTARFTSAQIRASSAAVSSLRANSVGHISPSSRLAWSLKPTVAYLVLNF